MLGIDENGQLLKHQITATTMDSEDLSHKIDLLGNVLQQMIQTGLFRFCRMKSKGHYKLTLIRTFLTKHSTSFDRFCPSSGRNSKETLELKQENEHLQNQITESQENSVKDIVQKIRERHIENEIVSTLRTEALQQYSQNHKVGFSPNFSSPHKLKWTKSNSF